MIALLFALAATPATDVACAALRGQGLERALARLPKEDKNVPLRGVALLIADRRVQAASLLGAAPDFAAYYAMALKNGPGGLGRAQQALAEGARREDAPADVLFLAALAFEQAGQRDKAHEVLKRALSRARDALDPAFAPEPANGIVRALEHAGEAPSSIVDCLVETGRTNLALRVASGPRDELAVWKDVDDTTALALAKRVLADDASNEDALATLLRIALSKRDYAVVKQRLSETTSESAAVLRARARLAIEAKDARAAVDAARAAAAADPKSDVGVALVIEAMLLDDSAAQAHAFAQTLLARSPVDVDPFELLVRVDRARGVTRKVRDNELRSTAFRSEWSGRRQSVADTEKVFRAVRSAEVRKSDTGLAELAAEDVRRRLPADLAIARLGAAGSARAARDRVLDACGDDLSRFLSRTKPWERRVVKTKIYPKPRDVVLVSSAADPARCARTTPMTGRRKPR